MFETILGILFICLSVYQVYAFIKGKPVFIKNSIWLLLLLAAMVTNLYIGKVMDGEALTITANSLLIYLLSSVIIAVLERSKKEKPNSES